MPRNPQDQYGELIRSAEKYIGFLFGFISATPARQTNGRGLTRGTVAEARLETRRLQSARESQAHESNTEGIYVQ